MTDPDFDITDEELIELMSSVYKALTGKTLNNKTKDFILNGPT